MCTEANRIKNFYYSKNGIFILKYNLKKKKWFEIKRRIIFFFFFKGKTKYL